MTITKNMLLYFIRDMGITILGETKTEQQFAGIKLDSGTERSER